MRVRVGTQVGVRVRAHRSPMVNVCHSGGTPLFRDINWHSFRNFIKNVPNTHNYFFYDVGVYNGLFSAE